MAARFAGIPAIPTTDMADWEAQVFHTIKENVELLCGTRGEGDEASKAVLKGNISVSSMEQQDMRVVSAQAKTWSGLTGLPGGESVADGPQFTALLKNVQVLANDLAEQRNTLNTLIEQLKT